MGSGKVYIFNALPSTNEFEAMTDNSEWSFKWTQQLPQPDVLKSDNRTTAPLPRADAMAVTSILNSANTSQEALPAFARETLHRSPYSSRTECVADYAHNQFSAFDMRSLLLPSSLSASASIGKDRSYRSSINTSNPASLSTPRDALLEHGYQPSRNAQLHHNPAIAAHAISQGHMAPQITAFIQPPVTTTVTALGTTRYRCRYVNTIGCGQTFTTSGHATRHSKLHTSKDIQCAFARCLYACTRADHMKQHLKAQHHVTTMTVLGTTRYRCCYVGIIECGQTFTTSGHASRHSKIHTSKDIQCAFAWCPYICKRAYNMRQHLKTQHQATLNIQSIAGLQHTETHPSSERHIKMHICHIVEMEGPRTAHTPLASPASLKVLLSLSTVPVFEQSVSAHGPSTLQDTTLRSKFPNSHHLQAEELLHNSLEGLNCQSDLASLQAFPKVRNLEFRALQLPRFNRSSNRKAALVYMVGNLVQAPCTRCAARYGPFS
ncbi:hypothetical protein VE03_10672, partial [Pseudogymnoascus sp. 23342-1-I1]